jgi:hypothetical protein
MSHDTDFLDAVFGDGDDGPGWNAGAAPGPSPEVPAEPPQPEPAAFPAAPPAPAAEVAAVTARQQALSALRQAVIAARLTWRMARRNEGGFINGIEHWLPPSIGGAGVRCTACGATVHIPGQIQYRDGRAWVPEGHYGGWSEQWGARYHTWWAIPAMIPAIIWLWLVVRPFRQIVALALFALTLAAVIAALIWLGIL